MVRDRSSMESGEGDQSFRPRAALLRLLPAGVEPHKFGGEREERGMEVLLFLVCVLSLFSFVFCSN